MNAVGSALMWPLITIYVHNVLHHSYGAAGFVLFCQSLAGVAGQFLGGSLYHRFGAKRLIVGSLLLSGVSQFSLLVATAWWPYIIAMMLNGFLNAMTMPAISAFIGYRFKEQRYQLFNLVYVCNNIGVAIGTSLAGALANFSFRLTFLFNGFTTIGFAVFFAFYVKAQLTDNEAENDVEIATGLRDGDRSIGLMMRDIRAYLFISLGSTLLFWGTSAWNTGVAPYLNQAGHSPTTYSFIWTVNGIVILVGQPLTTALNRYLTKSLYSRITASALFYTCGFFIMIFLHTIYWDLLLGMVVCTFGEMLVSPAVPALITQTTGRRAPFYLGVVGAFGNGGRLFGPLMFGYVFDEHGITPILILAAGFSLAAAVCFVIHHLMSSYLTQSQGVTSGTENLSGLP